ncbi:hypothetical protein AAF712_013643 [Marasmius tenuissimus]|uniref:Enoyl reductase (ER) domain-containing protein n=1 Tax=Marasmius tenuissimus TaxID=585030 RepID=A0ABR2ZGJ9_9AGAR
MSSQKALFLTEERGPFAVDTRDIQIPGVGEILVEIKAAALNPVDWKIQKTGSWVQNYPAVVGTDIAGDVAVLGEGVEGFSAGDRVSVSWDCFQFIGVLIVFQGFFTNDYAGFQQFTKVPAEIVAKIPESISYSQAASVPLGLATAAIGLYWTSRGIGLNPNLDKNVQFSDQPAVVVGGASSVGQYAIQMLKFGGFSPIITYASGHHTDYLKSLGATHIIDRKSVAIQYLPTEVRKITTVSVKTVYDAISLPDTQEASYNTLAEGGNLVIVLNSQIKDPVESKKVHHVFGNVQPEFNRSFGRTLYKQLTQFLQDGTVPNRVEELPNGLAGIPDGLKRLENDQVSGLKLIALPHETA